jgi:hypothetical protein
MGPQRYSISQSTRDEGEKHNLVVAQRKRIEEPIEKHAFIHLASKTTGISIQSLPTGEAPANFRKRPASEAGMEERMKT